MCWNDELFISDHATKKCSRWMLREKRRVDATESSPALRTGSRSLAGLARVRPGGWATAPVRPRCIQTLHCPLIPGRNNLGGKSSNLFHISSEFAKYCWGGKGKHPYSSVMTYCLVAVQPFPHQTAKQPINTQELLCFKLFQIILTKCLEQTVCLTLQFQIMQAYPSEMFLFPQTEIWIRQVMQELLKPTQDMWINLCVWIWG